MRPDEALSAGFFTASQEEVDTGPQERPSQRRRSASPTQSELDFMDRHAGDLDESMGFDAVASPTAEELEAAAVLGISPHCG